MIGVVTEEDYKKYLDCDLRVRELYEEYVTAKVRFACDSKTFGPISPEALDPWLPHADLYIFPNGRSKYE